MESSSSASGSVRLPGYPVTAIALPRQRSAGFLGNAYVARGAVGAAFAVLAIAGVSFAFLLTSFHEDMPAAHAGAGGKAASILAAEPEGASPIVAPVAVSREAELRAKADRLAGIEKTAAKLELLLAPQASPSPAPRLEIKVADGMRNGFWRSSGKNEQDFILVEATDESGSPVTMPVTDMDTGETKEVSRWAVRVSPREFSRLSAEKAISGSIGGLLAGVRNEGSEGIDWKLETEGGSLLEWQEGGQ